MENEEIEIVATGYDNEKWEEMELRKYCVDQAVSLSKNNNQQTSADLILVDAQKFYNWIKV